MTRPDLITWAMAALTAWGLYMIAWHILTWWEYSTYG